MIKFDFTESIFAFITMFVFLPTIVSTLFCITHCIKNKETIIDILHQVITITMFTTLHLIATEKKTTSKLPKQIDLKNL